MKVCVAVHGRFHGFDLAAELHRHGALAALLTTYPRFAARRFLPEGLPLRSAPALELLRRAAQRLGAPVPDLFIARRFARFVARALPADCDLLIGWSGATLEAIAPARRRGCKVVIERGSSHIAHQAAVLAELAGRPVVDPRMIAREEAEYAAADAIAVPTGYARDTFIARGVSAERLIVNPYGVDLRRFHPPGRRPDRDPARLVFVGRIGPRKGVDTLIAALERLSPGTVAARLIGPHDPGVAALLARADAAGIAADGALPGNALPAAYTDADIFCLPSREEGLPLTMLQAMAAGLPVIATPETGAADVMTDGVHGRIVPSGDPAALARAIGALAADPAARRAQGAAARQRVEHGFSWPDYGDRAIGLYRELLA